MEHVLLSSPIFLTVLPQLIRTELCMSWRGETPNLETHFVLCNLAETPPSCPK